MQIMKKLEKKGIHIARRTVAKYRDMEGILPAYQRKEQTK
jgi:RNA polymerase sigma-54 factor